MLKWPAVLKNIQMFPSYTEMFLKLIFTFVTIILEGVVRVDNLSKCSEIKRMHHYKHALSYSNDTAG